MNNELKGRYAIVRCKGAGVHAGVLEGNEGRECLLSDSRHLWYFEPADGSCFLSGAAKYGITDSSKVATPLEAIHLTETCAIIPRTTHAETRIREIPDYTERRAPS